MDVASRQVDKLKLTSCGSVLDEDDLFDVELYLSAHFVSITSPENNKTSEKFENYSISFDRGMQGSGILSSQFGATANLISGNCLTEMDRRKPALFFTGGA